MMKFKCKIIKKTVLVVAVNLVLVSNIFSQRISNEINTIRMTKKEYASTSVLFHNKDNVDVFQDYSNMIQVDEVDTNTYRLNVSKDVQCIISYSHPLLGLTRISGNSYLYKTGDLTFIWIQVQSPVSDKDVISSGSICRIVSVSVDSLGNLAFDEKETKYIVLTNDGINSHSPETSRILNMEIVDNRYLFFNYVTFSLEPKIGCGVVNLYANPAQATTYFNSLIKLILWQPGYFGKECDGAIIKAEGKIDYIHQNPVKAQIVYKAEDYIFSSASAYAWRESLVDIQLWE